MNTQNRTGTPTKQVEIVWTETNKYSGVFNVPADFDPSDEDQVDDLLTDPHDDHWDECLDRDVRKVKVLP